MKEYIVNSEEEHLFYGDKYEELIRCKDCKHNKNSRCTWHNSLNYYWVVDGEDYCSCAERKEE